MITPETFARIRRLFYAEHWKVGTIAAELDVHPDAVRRAIEVERFVRMGPQWRRPSRTATRWPSGTRKRGPDSVR